MLLKLYSILLRFDGPVLKSDSKFIEVLKRKILKPIGYYFRKKHFDLINK